MSVTVTICNTEADVSDVKDLTFMERLRRTHLKQKNKGRSPHLSRAMFCYLIGSSLYTFCNYLAPYSYGYLGEWRVYQIKVLFTFCAVNCFVNMLCLIFYDTSIKKTKDRPGLPRHLWEKPPDHFIPYLYNHPETGRAVKNGMAPDRKYINHMEHKDGLPWTFCEICDVDLPPRAIHCSTCKKCILKRDHHCYLSGVCIGHYNQRYFVMFAFFGMVGGLWAVYLTFYYVIDLSLDKITWLDVFPPWSGWRVFTGEMALIDFVMLHHLWTLTIGGIAGLGYFVSHITLIVLNKTLYEYTRRDPYRSTTPIRRNFQSVFGDFWGLNFIFPAQILFRQSDDGYHWEGLKLKRLPQMVGSKRFQ